MFRPTKPHLYFAPEGAPSGSPAESKQPDAKVGPDTTGGEGGDAQPKDGGKQGGEGQEKVFSQADLDRIVTERLERERRKRETDAQKEREKSEAAILKEKEDFKALAEKHEGKIAALESQVSELDTLKETHARYETALKKYLEESRADLPKHILALLDKLDVVDQLEYIASNAQELNKPKAKGMPETPDAAKQKELSETERQIAQRSSNAIYRSLF